MLIAHLPLNVSDPDCSRRVYLASSTCPAVRGRATTRSEATCLGPVAASASVLYHFPGVLENN